MALTHGDMSTARCGKDSRFDAERDLPEHKVDARLEQKSAYSSLHLTEVTAFAKFQTREGQTYYEFGRHSQRFV
jgi:hypothetical protein